MKKLIAILISVVLVFSSMGTLFASAATQSDAEAAAAAFNEAKTDYTKEYLGNRSRESVAKQMNQINSLIAKILAKKDIKSKVYSDETVTKICAALAGVTKTSLKSVDYPAVKDAFPEAYKYIEQAKADGKDWDTLGTVPFGVTDKAAFENAVGALSSNFGGVIAIACAMSPGLYESALVPLFESLHVGKMLTKEEFAAKTGFDGAKTMTFIAGYLTNAIEAFFANPVLYITDVLPDFVASYNVFAQAIAADPMAGAFGLKMPALDSIIKGLDLNGLKLPEINLDKLAGMATAKAVESGLADGYDVELNGDKEVVFSAVMKYLKKVLSDKENQEVIKGMIRNAIGINDDDYNALVSAIKALDFNGVISSLNAILDSMIDTAIPSVSAPIAKLLVFIQKIIRFFNRFIPVAA